MHRSVGSGGYDRAHEAASESADLRGRRPRLISSGRTSEADADIPPFRRHVVVGEVYRPLAVTDHGLLVRETGLIVDVDDASPGLATVIGAGHHHAVRLEVATELQS